MNIFSTHGRLSRTNYFILLMGILLVSYIVDRFFLPNPILDRSVRYYDSYYDESHNAQIWKGVLALIVWFLIWIQSIKRLQDTGKTGWYSCVYMMPPFIIPIMTFTNYQGSSNLLTPLLYLLGIAGLIALLFTIFAPGTTGANIYGENPRKIKAEQVEKNSFVETVERKQSIVDVTPIENSTKQTRMTISSFQIAIPHRVILSVTVLLLCFIITAKIAADRTSYAYLTYHPTKLVAGDHKFDIGSTWMYWSVFILTQAFLQLKIWTAKVFPIIKFKNTKE